MKISASSFIPMLVAASLAAPAPAVAQSYDSGTTYPNPDGDMNNFSNKPCRDPWVTIAVQIVYGTATQARCPIELYNKGRWNSFNQLVHAVAATRKELKNAKVSLSPRWVIGTNRVVPVLIDSNSGSIVAAGAGNIVAAGGGNVTGNSGTSQRPSRLIGMDGATLIGNDAGSIKSMKYDLYQSMTKVDLKTGRNLMGSRVIRLPGGNSIVVQ